VRDEVTYTHADLRQIAYHQKMLLRWVLAYLVAFVVVCVTHPILDAIGNEVVQNVVSAPIVIFILFVPFAWSFCILNLATKVEGTGGGCVLFVFCAIPLLGLILVLSLNEKATKVLKKHGIRVGLMGARMADFDRAPNATTSDDPTPA
jgi:hypothetical protein